MRVLDFALTLITTLAPADVAGTACVLDGANLEIYGQWIRLYEVDTPLPPPDVLMQQGRLLGAQRAM